MVKKKKKKTLKDSDWN